MIKKIDLNKSSENIFLLGTFLLASTVSVGIFLISIASIISFTSNKKEFYSDKWIKVLLLIGFLMICACIFQTVDYRAKDLFGWNISYTWIGLLNWLPLFFLFISAQNFLKTTSQRLRVSIFLFSGTIPVFITGLGQYYLGWQGPFSFLNGLIIWYLKEIEPHSGLSGLFSNQNYTGTWLSSMWPFCLSFVFLNNKSKFKRILSIIFLIITTWTIVLTTSRNALLGVLISIPLIIGLKSLFVILSIIILLLIIFIFRSYLPFASEFLDFLSSIIPSQFINKFNKVSLTKILEFRRINLWKESIEIISRRPIFGIGAAFFPILYEIYYEPSNYIEQHTHNLFIDLAASYGFLTSFITISFITALIFLAWKSIQADRSDNKQFIINKCWLASTIIIVFSQINDITYYDGRISIIFWILLSGLRNIIV